VQETGGIRHVQHAYEEKDGQLWFPKSVILLEGVPAGSSAIQIPETPKVLAPKQVAIKFDESEIRQNLQEAVSMLNQQMASTNRGLGFRIDEAVGGPVVTVRSAETGEVVRQIPNEVVVRVAHNIEKVKGLLLNARV
jgi:flagellar protein FlaG